MNKQILEYLDNQLDKNDRKSFELKLEHSPDLQKELEKTRAILAAMKPGAHTWQQDGYYAEARSRFREKVLASPKRAQHIPAYSAIFSMSTVIVVVSLFLLRGPSSQSLQKAFWEDYANLQTEEKLELLQENSAVGLSSSNVTDDIAYQDVENSLITDDNADLQKNAENVLNDLNLSPDELANSVAQDALDSMIK
ncbi:MAG: hypothetical protein LWX56_07770 [Ignavibacteria bacterium]|nr:hypothetical protein [Ignavibacteria bacterium]